MEAEKAEVLSDFIMFAAQTKSLSFKDGYCLHCPIHVTAQRSGGWRLLYDLQCSDCT